MDDSPLPVRLRAVNGGNQLPPWALAEIRDDPKEAVGCQAPSGTSPGVAVNVSAIRKTSSTRMKMSNPSQFMFKKELGSGSWSTVMEASHVASGVLYAVKILSKSQLIKLKKVKYATVEKDALVKLSGTHPGIVRMHAAFQDETSLYFILDLAPHGDLADLVKNFVDAVLWIHSMGIVHRDLKPENVLLDNQFRIKLTDFGSAYSSPEGDLSPRASTFVGSAAYVSPELLNRASKTTSSSSDIWAIGCSTYFMIAGVPAFAAINDYQSFRKIEALDYTFPEGFYDVAKNFVQKLLVLDPSDRLGAEPKSSPSELRDHSIFTGAECPNPEESEGTPVSWDTLWTDSPMLPEMGIIGPSPTTIIPQAEDDSLWDNVVHEFSLVDVNQASANTNAGGKLISSNDLVLPTAIGSMEVAPDAILTNVDDSIAAGEVQESTEDAIASNKNNPTTAYNNAISSSETNDPVLLTKDWSSSLGTGETVRAAVHVQTLIRRGLSKQLRICVLLLTSLPRVLCIISEESNKAARKPEVKQSFVFPGRPVSRKGDKVLAKCRLEKEQRRLVLQTDEKEYVYDFSNDKSLAKWTQEISALLGSP